MNNIKNVCDKILNQPLLSMVSPNIKEMNKINP